MTETNENSSKAFRNARRNLVNTQPYKSYESWLYMSVK